MHIKYRVKNSGGNNHQKAAVLPTHNRHMRSHKLHINLAKFIPCSTSEHHSYVTRQYNQFYKAVTTNTNLGIFEFKVGKTVN
jgi:hypothetical protein